MLRTGLLHPQILHALGGAGHGSLVLISDGNFPSTTAPNPRAAYVFLNLRRGVVSVTDILCTVAPLIPIERARVMDPDDGSSPPIHAELVRLLPAGTPVDHVERKAFYAASRSDDLALVIVSGDERWYGNVLLTIGAIPQDAGFVSDR